MRWIEIITLRSAGDDEKQMIVELLKQVEQAGEPGQPREVRIYRHAAVETDLSIHISWESDSVAQPHSTLGDLLVSATRDFGMVSHSIWIEKEGISNGS
jgi:hypothetical protein